MTVGFQIFNADGVTVQVDDNYRNLSVREQGTAVTNQAASFGQSSSLLFYRTGLTTPLIAVAGGGYAAAQSYYDAPNARYGFIITSASGVGAQVPYYIFDVPFDSSPGFGLQVFNPAGQKTFDILQKYLRVIDVRTSNARDGTTYNYDPSRSYACIHTVNGWSINYQAGNTAMKCSSTSGGTVNTTGVIVDGSQGIKTIYEQQGTILVVDVTNY
jgi:hypothetical protein